MAAVIAYLLFLFLLIISVRLLFLKEGIIPSPYSYDIKMRCTGMELLIIFIFCTALLAILPLVALRLAILQMLCIIGIIMSKNRIIYSFPLILFICFMLWVLLGISYASDAQYGVRMLLKYAAPFFVCLFTSSVVRNGEILLKSLQCARICGIIAMPVLFIPSIATLFGLTFWNFAAIVTHYISLSMFSLALCFFSNDKKKNLAWFIAFTLPCFLKVFRTDIMGTILAICAFFTIKYRLKAIPVLVVMSCLSLASIFYIPSVKAKMYFRPDEVELIDFLTGNIAEDNINTSGRNSLWEGAMRIYESGNELIGSGTGTVQKYMYETYNYGAQLHGDFLVMLVDNGLIGLILFLLVYLTAVVHCIMLYHNSSHSLLKLGAIVAGSSLIGILATMYSDNTISYSLATLTIPWGIYGMVLGMRDELKSNKIV